jgi:hypothetical protein
MFSIAYDRLIHTLTLGSYQALNWLFLFLCVAAFCARSYVRYAYFRLLLFEDYLMLFALVIHTAEAILIQLYVQYVYNLEAVGKGDLSKITPDFMPNSRKGFIAVGTSINLTIIGVLIVKLNFLLFFRRLGKNLNRFNIAWWTILTFTIAVTIAQITMQRFGCFFGEIMYIFSGHCTDKDALKHISVNAIFSAVVDAISDFMSKSEQVVIMVKYV